MIKDQIDFEYNLEQLNKEFDTGIKLQEEFLDSDSINKAFQIIETDLNLLYEKTRYLEDAIDYTKTFISLKIEDYSSKISSIIKSIEDINKASKNLGYIEYNVPFIKNAFSIHDRNKNYKIEPCKIKNVMMNDVATDLIVLDNRINLNNKYNSLTRKCEQVPYDENLHDLVNDKPYKVLYIEEKPISNGVTETITMYLPEPIEANELNIKTANCSVSNVRYVYANGIEEQAGEYITGIESKSRIVTHVKFDLKCLNYNTTTYELDTDEISKGVWNYIKLTELYNGEIPPDKLTAALNEENSDSDKEITSDILVSRSETTSTNTNYKAYKKAPDQILKLIVYTYNFGVDLLQLNRVVQHQDGYFISNPISIGNLSEKEYIQLNVDDCCEESCSIEYYILDGDREIHIMPVNCKFINNERIFPEEDLRFAIDFNIYGDGLKQIKKDGINTSISLDDAKTQYDGKYSADYLPIYEYYKYTPLNNNIKIKAIIRTFGNTIPVVPYIKTINIRKFGGEALWTNLY